MRRESRCSADDVAITRLTLPIPVGQSGEIAEAGNTSRRVLGNSSDSAHLSWRAGSEWHSVRHSERLLVWRP